MNIFFKIVFFMVMFNIAAVMIAATGFFPNTIYGDLTYAGIDENTVTTPENVFDRLILNAGEPVVIVGKFTLNWATLIGSIVAITIIVGAITRSTVVVTLGIISTLFVFMYSNSKSAFDRILDNLDSSAAYVGVMLGVGVLILVIIVIMDYAAGQKNA